MIRNAMWTLALAVGLAGCGSNKLAAGPCEGANPAPECGASCSDTEPCADGFYCDDSGQCTADCVAGGGQCASGYHCDEQGQCVADPGDGGLIDSEGCGTINVTLHPVIPTVLILIDRSGSMADAFGGQTRWSAMVSALVDPTNGVIAKLEDEVVFGAALYNSNGGNAGGTCPILIKEPPGDNDYARISTMLNDNGPTGDTPTAESIDGVVGDFPTPDPENPEPQILVLATDGDPDNCVDPDAHDDTSKAMSVTAVQAAYTAGIKTFALGIDNDISPGHLQKLANAGVGVDPDTGTEPYYLATSPQALTDAFNDIITGARTCDFTIDGTVDLDQADQGTVVLNGGNLIYGTDWELSDADTLTLLGDACTTFLDDPDVTLFAEFPCGAVVL